MKTPDHAAEVLIIDATGFDAGDAERLREGLVRRGLRVKSEFATPGDSPALRSRLIDGAGRADYCVLLLPDDQLDGVEPRGGSAYLAIPRREHADLRGSEALPGSRLSIGRPDEEVDALADRIAAFLEFVRRHSHGLDAE